MAESAGRADPQPPALFLFLLFPLPSPLDKAARNGASFSSVDRWCSPNPPAEKGRSIRSPDVLYGNRGSLEHTYSALPLNRLHGRSGVQDRAAWRGSENRCARSSRPLRIATLIIVWGHPFDRLIPGRWRNPFAPATMIPQSRSGWPRMARRSKISAHWPLPQGTTPRRRK